MAKLKLGKGGVTLACVFAGLSAELGPGEGCGVAGLAGAPILLLANAGELLIMSVIDGNDCLSMLDNLEIWLSLKKLATTSETCCVGRTDW